MVSIFQIENSFAIFKVYHFNFINCLASHKMDIVGLNLFILYRLQTKFLEIADISNWITLTSIRGNCVRYEAQSRRSHDSNL